MEEFREALIIMISVPVYAVVIGFEFFYSYLRERKLYSAQGLLQNTYLTLANMSLDVFVRGICLLTLQFFFTLSHFKLDLNPIVYWTLLVLFQDLMYYWLHRVDHYCRFFWAVHVTHHNSEEFNLTTGFRSSVFQPLYRFIYFIPIALAGFRPIDILFVYSATQIFGILVHTQTVRKLGVLEYIFVTPSHHRVHHASNVHYLDKNMGMLLIIWDRLFGTFQAEIETVKPVYGLTSNVKSNNPFKIIFHEWNALFHDITQKGLSWKQRWNYAFGPPGYSHDNSRKTSRQLQDSLPEGPAEAIELVAASPESVAV